MAITLVLALAVPLVLPARFSLGPSWAVPLVEALLLAALVTIDRGRIDPAVGHRAGAVAGAGGRAGRAVPNRVSWLRRSSPTSLSLPSSTPGSPGRAAPNFFDYLYLGFTNATAFSPTDVMPLARWAKLAMTVQAVCSLMILGLVIARAANILK